MKKTILTITFILMAAGLVFTYMVYLTFCSPNTIRESYLYVHENATVDSLANVMVNDSLIKFGKTFLIAAKREKLEGNIKAGRYRIEERMNNRAIARMFKLGLQQPTNLVLAGNIRTLDRLSGIISKQISADSSDIHSVLINTEVMKRHGLNEYTFPGIFLLNTYEVYWTTTPEDLVARMKREFDRFWNQERISKAEQLGLTPMEVTTLASIVAEESTIPSEHPVIAGVYINRLKRGMLLQADPTVKFALNDPSIRRILFRHLEIDSPYNTYKRPGLPPGPITLPSPAIIDAVLNYTRHNYLYFCANPSLDGSHAFASTLSEHNKNARAYHQAINKLNL